MLATGLFIKEWKVKGQSEQIVACFECYAVKGRFEGKGIKHLAISVSVPVMSFLQGLFSL